MCNKPPFVSCENSPCNKSNDLLSEYINLKLENQMNSTSFCKNKTSSGRYVYFSLIVNKKISLMVRVDSVIQRLISSHMLYHHQYNIIECVGLLLFESMLSNLAYAFQNIQSSMNNHGTRFPLPVLHLGIYNSLLYLQDYHMLGYYQENITS